MREVDSVNAGVGRVGILGGWFGRRISLREAATIQGTASTSTLGAAITTCVSGCALG